MAGRQRLLRDQRMRFPVSQIAWRRTNQFSNLVGVLELRAIDLDDRAGIPKQDLRRRFDDAGFSGSSGPQKQQVPYRAPRRIQAGAKHLVQVNQRLYGLFLTHNLRSQRRLKINRVRAALAWIERKSVVVHDRLLANPPVRVAVPLASPIKLFQFDLDGRLQEPQLYQQLPCHHGRF